VSVINPNYVGVFQKMIKSVDTFCFIMFTKSDEINTLSDIKT